MKSMPLCISDDVTLSYWRALLQRDAQMLSAWDLLSSDLLKSIDLDEAFQEKKPKKLNPRPWIAFTDLNNFVDAPYENKPKTAIEIGIAFDF